MTHFCYFQEQAKLMYGNKNDKAIASGKGIDGKRLKGIFWGHRNTLYLALLGVKWAYIIVKTHQTEHGISIYSLYSTKLHKLDFN